MKSASIKGKGKQGVKLLEKLIEVEEIEDKYDRHSIPACACTLSVYLQKTALLLLGPMMDQNDEFCGRKRLSSSGAPP